MQAHVSLFKSTRAYIYRYKQKLLTYVQKTQGKELMFGIK